MIANNIFAHSVRAHDCAQEFLRVGNYYVSPRDMFGAGFMWEFDDGSSMVMTGRPAIDRTQFQFYSVAIFGANGEQINSFAFYPVQTANNPFRG